MRPLMAIHYMAMIGTPGLLVLIAIFALLGLEWRPLVALQAFLAILFTAIASLEFARDRRKRGHRAPQ